MLGVLIVKLKTQVDIRRIELIGIIIFSLLNGKNISLETLEMLKISEVDFKLLYDLFKSAYLCDFFTSFYSQRVTSEYKELKEMYDEVIKNTSVVVNELGINDPVSLFACYVYLYRNGYLSNGHKFVYSTDMKDFTSLGGIDIIRGTGVCRSISSFFTDLCIEQGYSASNLGVKATSASCKNLQKLCDKELEKSSSGVKLVKLVSNLTGKVPVPNHLISLVQDQGICYLLDPTNDGYLVYGGNNQFLVPNTEDSFMKYFSSFQFMQKVLGVYKASSCKEIREVFNLPSISEGEYYTRYIEALKKCIDSIDLFEQLYNDNHWLYNDICAISEEQKGLIGRTLPLVPNLNKVKRRSKN